MLIFIIHTCSFAYAVLCVGEGSFSATSLPLPVWVEGIVLCVCVCYHKIAVKFKLSQNLNKLHLTNLAILNSGSLQDRQVLTGKHGLNDE